MNTPVSIVTRRSRRDSSRSLSVITWLRGYPWSWRGRPPTECGGGGDRNRRTTGSAHTGSAHSPDADSARIPADCACSRPAPFRLLTYFDIENGKFPPRALVFSEEISGLALKFGRCSA